MGDMRTYASFPNATASGHRCMPSYRTVAILICTLILFALAVICTACKPAFTDEDKAAFTGRWELVSFGIEPEPATEDAQSSEEGEKEDDGSKDGEESDEGAAQEETEEQKAAKERQLSEFDVLLYKEWGLTSDLILAGDGTCAFTFYGDLYEGTWKMESAGEASIELIVQNDGKPQKETYSLILENGLLTMKVPDSPVVFKKVETAEEAEEVIEEEGEPEEFEEEEEEEGYEEEE